ncbi:MAG: hypothetical protein NZ901_12235 [Geminocystis sp.]|nr:hypothetical protein [Geminocystis sp.]MDW8117216.1 hypothetical protein [Geminocystis sp.]
MTENPHSSLIPTVTEKEKIVKEKSWASDKSWDCNARPAFVGFSCFKVNPLFDVKSTEFILISIVQQVFSCHLSYQ